MLRSIISFSFVFFSFFLRCFKLIFFMLFVSTLFQGGDEIYFCIFQRLSCQRLLFASSLCIPFPRLPDPTPHLSCFVNQKKMLVSHITNAVAWPLTTIQLVSESFECWSLMFSFFVLSDARSALIKPVRFGLTSGVSAS